MANPTTKTWFRNSPENPNIKSFYRSITSTSNRVNGVVLKKQTPHGAMTGVIKRRIRAGKADERGMVDPGADTGFPRVFDAEMSQCTQRALAKFEGKVRKGSANLGVTIAQWGQANEMIIHRLDQVAGLLGKRVKNTRAATEACQTSEEIRRASFSWSGVGSRVRVETLVRRPSRVHGHRLSRRYPTYLCRGAS